jgi:hypothetical protein
MARFCRFCNKEEELPVNFTSNAHWMWENKKDRPSGGLHYCATDRKAKKRAAWDVFYQKKQLRCVVSRSVMQKLKTRGHKKNGSIISNLPYSLESLEKHLESKFELGMTWDNYGDWHLDHIVPDSWFQYSSMEDEGFKNSWALDNLQPKWAMLNWSKGNRFIG